MIQEMDMHVISTNIIETLMPHQVDSTSTTSTPKEGDEPQDNSLILPSELTPRIAESPYSDEGSSPNAAPAAEGEILTRFPTLPGELRNMVYAAMINKPRLLPADFRKHWRGGRPANRAVQRERSELPPDDHSRLPASLLLNKEAYVEIMKHIVLVPKARENNVSAFPWSYINPRYDTLYLSSPGSQFRHAATRTPGIRTMAFRLNSVLLSKLCENPWSRRMYVHQLLKQPDLEEILFVICLCELKRGTGKCRVEYHPLSGPETEIRLRQHSCGFFGVIDENTEKMLSEIPPKHPLTYYNDARERILSLERAFAATAHDGPFYVGKKLPKITMAHHMLGADGRWQPKA